MNAPDPNAELVQWLQSRGHSMGEIDRILKRLSEFDQQAIRGSIFDAIDAGEFDIEAVIREALGEKEE